MTEDKIQMMVHQLNKKNGKPREQLDLNRCSQGYPHQNLELLDVSPLQQITGKLENFIAPMLTFCQKGKRD